MVRLLDEYRLHVGSIEDRWQQIISEAGVENDAVLHKQFLHNPHPHTLEDAALNLTDDRLRIQGFPHVLGSVDLNDSYQSELGVNIDHGTLSSHRKPGVDISLPVFIGLLSEWVPEPNVM